MAFLDYSGLSRFTSKLKAWINGIVGDSTMGTTATTLTGAIAEHTEQITALEAVDPVLAVNNIAPDANGNVHIGTVDYAFNLVADDAQSSSGEFVYRTTGGDASLSDGDAWLSTLKGDMVHIGYVPESIEWDLETAPREEGEPITASFNRNTFVAYVATSGTITLSYTSSWSADPTLYGFTITGTPVSGDTITIDYTKEARGTITMADPGSFSSTGWNLFNYDTGYARTIKYSELYGFIVGGSYTTLEWSATPTPAAGDKQTITPSAEGAFTVPADGYVWVTGGDNTTTYIYMTWSDWTSGYAGNWAAYTESTIDFSTIMTNFDYGLCRIGTTADIIDFDLGVATSWIDRVEYSAENLVTIQGYGRPYECDEQYIYFIKETADTYSFNIDGTYYACDHGIEFFSNTTVPVFTSMLYGQNLKDKLRTDVLTISAQTLTNAQKTQVRTNIGAAADANVVHNTGDETIDGKKRFIGRIVAADSATTSEVSFGNIGFDKHSASVGYASATSGGKYSAGRMRFYQVSPKSDGSDLTDCYERYQLPQVDKDMTSIVNYTVLTSKQEQCLYQSSATAHSFTLASGYRGFLIHNGDGVTRTWIGFVYVSSTGVVTVAEIYKGSSVTESHTTNTITFTMSSASSCYLRCVDCRSWGYSIKNA